MEKVMRKLNKKGFTLVELLAVIVILAVVMLIAVTAVGPLMAKSRKSALGTEGVGLVNAAKTAYQAEQLNNASAIKATSTVCFDLDWLCEKGYWEKCSADGYSGSVMAKYTGSGKIEYKFWISNGTYIFGANSGGFENGVNPAGYDVESDSVVRDATSSDNAASKTCGGDTTAGLVKCTNSTCA